MTSPAGLPDPALLAALLRSLSQRSPTGSLQAVPPTVGSMENIIRALATLPILADLGIDNPTGTSPNASRGGSVLEPISVWPFPNLFKLPGLFGDIKLNTPGPKS